jgi:hypothetical protein
MFKAAFFFKFLARDAGKVVVAVGVSAEPREAVEKIMMPHQNLGSGRIRDPTGGAHVAFQVVARENVSIMLFVKIDDELL